MTIDEAIADEKEIANMLYDQQRSYSAYYHKQLAEWLEDYKRLKELFSTCEQEIYQKAYKEGQDKEFSDSHSFGYNKAIDDFVKAL